MNVNLFKIILWTLLAVLVLGLFWAFPPKSKQNREDAELKQLQNDAEMAKRLERQAKLIRPLYDLLLIANEELTEHRVIGKEVLTQLQKLLSKTYPDLSQLPAGPFKVVRAEEFLHMEFEPQKAYLIKLEQLSGCFDSVLQRIDEDGKPFKEWEAGGAAQRLKADEVIKRRQEYRDEIARLVRRTQSMHAELVNELKNLQKAK